MNPIDIQNAKPQMLTRPIYNRILAIGMAELMEGTTVDFTPRRSKWPSILLVAVVLVIGWQFKGVIG